MKFIIVFNGVVPFQYIGYFLSDKMITQVYFAVQYAKVEIVTHAKFSMGHYQVVSFFSYDNPDDFVAWLENVFFHAVFF